MDTAEAVAFASRWVADWNAQDLEAMLSHFDAGVVFTSPVAARVVPASDGVIHGRDELRAYGAQALAQIPDLHFEVEAVYAGVETIVINDRNHLGALVCEVLELAGNRVVHGHGTYLTDDSAGSSGVGADRS